MVRGSGLDLLWPLALPSRMIFSRYSHISHELQGTTSSISTVSLACMRVFGKHICIAQAVHDTIALVYLCVWCHFNTSIQSRTMHDRTAFRLVTFLHFQFLSFNFCLQLIFLSLLLYFVCFLVQLHCIEHKCQEFKQFCS